MQYVKYIKDLLIDLDYIIIPGFGAFEAFYKSSEFNSENSKIFPPKKDIVFNERIKKNDNVLIKYISLVEKINIDEATRNVKKFTENIQYELEKKGKVIFDNFGELILGRNREIIFHFFSEDNLLSEAFGLPETSVKDEFEKEPEKIIINTKKISGKRRRWIWVFLIVFPVLVAFIFIYLNYLYQPLDIYQDVLDENLSEPQILVEDTIKNVTEPLTDSIIKGDEIIEYNETESPQIFEGERFYLIGGSFKDQENADKYFNELSDMGYEPIYLGLRGNFYIVAIGVYPTVDEAIAAKDENIDINPGIWILKETD